MQGYMILLECCDSSSGDMRTCSFFQQFSNTFSEQQTQGAWDPSLWEQRRPPWKSRSLGEGGEISSNRSLPGTGTLKQWQFWGVRHVWPRTQFGTARSSKTKHLVKELVLFKAEDQKTLGTDPPVTYSEVLWVLELSRQRRKAEVVL